jgi:hypothetical protein
MCPIDPRKQHVRQVSTSTDTFEKLLNKKPQKQEDIWWEFYSTEAMINRE